MIRFVRTRKLEANVLVSFAASYLELITSGSMVMLSLRVNN